MAFQNVPMASPPQQKVASACHLHGIELSSRNPLALAQDGSSTRFHEVSGLNSLTGAAPLPRSFW